MLIIGSKVKLIKAIKGAERLNIGDVFEVTKIENNIITFKCVYGYGMMSYKEYEEYFEVVRKWTDWRMYKSKGLYYYYKHDGETIMLRNMNSDIVTKAVCHKDDEFDLDKGLELCFARMELVKAQRHLDNVLDNL